MKVLEFQTQIASDGTLKLPPDIAAQIPGDDPVRVVLVFDDSSEDEDWKRLTADRFLAGYSQDDDIYEVHPTEGSAAFSPEGAATYQPRASEAPPWVCRGTNRKP